MHDCDAIATLNTSTCEPRVTLMMVYVSLSSLSLLSGIKQHHDNVGGD
jgi:hypothetical protein